MVHLTRRLGGGRPGPQGAGFVGVALALPQRNALLAPDQRELAPEQILNRYVRGLLGGLERLGVHGYYPGRDIVTVDGKLLANLALEIEPDGATLIEMCVATDRSFAEVTRFVDRADPGGTVGMDFIAPEQATSIAAVAGRAPTLEAFARALADGFAERLGVEAIVAGPPRIGTTDRSWIAAGYLAAHLDRRARIPAMLGVIEVRAARAGDVVADVRVCGDLIAPSDGIARLEAALRGAPIDRETLRRRVSEVFAASGDFILGLRDLTAIGDLVFDACSA